MSSATLVEYFLHFSQIAICQEERLQYQLFPDQTSTKGWATNLHIQLHSQYQHFLFQGLLSRSVQINLHGAG